MSACVVPMPSNNIRHLSRQALKCSVAPAVLVVGLQDTATLYCKSHVQLPSCKARELLLVCTFTAALCAAAVLHNSSSCLTRRALARTPGAFQARLMPLTLTGRMSSLSQAATRLAIAFASSPLNLRKLLPMRVCTSNSGRVMSQLVCKQQRSTCQWHLGTDKLFSRISRVLVCVGAG